MPTPLGLLLSLSLIGGPSDGVAPLPPSKLPLYDIKREFKAGERDTFRLRGDFILADGKSIHFEGKLVQHCRKVEKLTADIGQITSCTFSSSDVKVDFTETNRVANVKYTKYGVIFGGEKTTGNEYPYGDMLQFAQLTPMNGIKVGHSVTFDSRDSNDPRSYCKGWVGMAALQGKQAILNSEIEYLNDACVTPVKYSNQTVWNLDLQKPDKIHTVITGLPSVKGQLEIKKIVIDAERILPK